MNGILMLAAGASRRFGSDKRLAQLQDGRTVLETSIENALASGLSVLVILKHDELDLRETLAAQYPDAHILRCPDSALGMGHSLAFGVAQAANLRFYGIAVAYADMPWVEPASYSAVGRRITPDKILVPRYGQQHGNPIGFGNHYFSELKSCRGDKDTHAIWQGHMDRVEYLELTDAGILRDINTAEDISD
jgi:molybdenum cofactor cytidylyltransferase